MRALITGATGFIGGHLVAALRRRGDDVVCVVRKPVISSDSGIDVIAVDLSQSPSFDQIVDRCGRLDAFFHLAAAMPNEPGLNASDFLTANGHATKRCVEIARVAGAGHFIYISSLSVLGKPLELPITEQHSLAPSSAYAIGKLAGEMACETARLDGNIAATSLRITSPYGPGMKPASVLPHFAAQALRGEVLRWFGSGSRAQDFVHVDDVVAACLLAAATGNPGIYNIGAGQPTTMRSLAEMVTAAVPGSTATADGRPDEQEGVVWQVEIGAAKNSLGYCPKVDLPAGIAAYLDDLRAPSAAASWWRPAGRRQ